MANLASKVVLIEAEDHLTAVEILQKRVFANSKIEVRCGTRVSAILGESKVEAIELARNRDKGKDILHVDGVLVYVGIEPNTTYLESTVPLDSDQQIVVNDRMETEIPYVLAAGDIRCGSARQIVTAVGDGAAAALSAMKLLREMSSL